MVNRIYAGLRTALERDERVLLLGEDIEGPYGGAFKATKDLSQLFPGRVRNTPISELAITGIGNGLALAGMRPVVEIMFGDFVTLASRPDREPRGEVSVHVRREGRRFRWWCGRRWAAGADTGRRTASRSKRCCWACRGRG